MDEFARTTLPATMPVGATNEAVYQHLRSEYFQNLEKYRHLIVPGIEPQQKVVPVEEVSKSAKSRTVDENSARY
ncbi:hypothetical protein [Nostoc commune]|uniref:hypothetical protein n=1 Tax=Nostoc commune TaxID=1178 RepID=UPI0018C7C038|nr:hypothetical protein [Nostoc commune]MBG1262012.1 hypothetical protein [Nostoc commune BAE]